MSHVFATELECAPTHMLMRDAIRWGAIERACADGRDLRARADMMTGAFFSAGLVSDKIAGLQPPSASLLTSTRRRTWTP